MHYGVCKYGFHRLKPVHTLHRFSGRLSLCTALCRLFFAASCRLAFNASIKSITFCLGASGATFISFPSTFFCISSVRAVLHSSRVGSFLIDLGCSWILASHGWRCCKHGHTFVILFITLPGMLKVVNQYQRAVLLRFGKLQSVLEPGLNVILPWGIDRALYVEMRTTTIDVPKQDIITRDNVPVSVDAVVYFNVFDLSWLY